MGKAEICESPLRRRVNTPEAIIYVELPESVYEAHETLFSTYQTKKMRDFLLNELISDNYELASQIDLENGYIISVYCLT